MTTFGTSHGQNTISLPGNKFSALVPPLDVELFFNSKTELTFKIKDAGGISPSGHTETVKTQIIEVRPNLYFLGWKEKTGATVTHVEDYNNTILYTNITLDDGQFINLVGVIKPVGTETKTTRPDSTETLTGRRFNLQIAKEQTELYFMADSLEISTDPNKPKKVVNANVTEIYPKVFLVTWQEASKTTIVQVLDLENHKVWFNQTDAKQKFTRKKGTFKITG